MMKNTNLNLGCGNVIFENWINIDLHNPMANLKCDIRKPLPYENDSVMYIYSEHFIEHLTWDEGISLLKECFRILKPNGIVRTATFDLDAHIRWSSSLNSTWKEDIGFHKVGLDFVTRAQHLNFMFRNYEHDPHKYLYDTEELIRLYRESGFYKIESCRINESSSLELINRESRFNSTLIIEGTK